MPLTKKGKRIESSMEKTYGKDKGERIFYASVNKGTVKGAEGTETRVKTKPDKKPAK